MIRAVQTADLIKNHLKEDLPVSIDPLLCEGKPHELEFNFLIILKNFF